MGHDHSHHHHAPDKFNLAFGLAVGLNLAFTIIEAIYAMSANSMSLLADAGHNLGDVLGLAMAWLASWLLTRAVTNRYSYGFKRTSIIAALLNSLILVVTSVLIAIESIQKLIHPEHVNEITVIVIALIGIVINGSTAMMFIKGRHDDLNIKGAFLHLAYDALISFGVVVVGIVIYFTHWYYLDPIVGLLIVAAILFGTWSLLRDSVNMLLDAVPHHIKLDEVKAYLESVEDVQGVHDLHVWNLSTKEAACTAHLTIAREKVTDEKIQAISAELEKRFKIHHSTIQTETTDHCHSGCSS